MPYSSFSFADIKKLDITVKDQSRLFADVNEVDLSQGFVENLLTDNLPLALAINTEKSRSELIISPVLMELRKLLHKQISLFSGTEFNVDESHNLKGVCDFIISLSAEQFFIDAPIITIVEAKKDNIIDGIPQCIAEMRAAQIFNERQEKPLPVIYGVVTSGSLWKFLRLEGQTLFLDLDEYYIKEIHKIIGILEMMCIGDEAKKSQSIR